MKKQMLQILTEVSKGNKNPEIAQNELLGLFSVSQRSELLSDFEKWLDRKGNESYCSLPTQYVVDKYKSLNCG